MSAVTTTHLFDGFNANYPFSIFSIQAIPNATNAVYIFCYFQGNGYVLLYVGAAGDLSTRLSGHDRMQAALNMGATHLLVYAPDPSYMDVERRFIAHYKPALNVQHTT